jgi:hypothetical protein
MAFRNYITCDETSRAVLLSFLSIFHQFNDLHKLGTSEISERRKRRGSRFSYQTSTFIPDDHGFVPYLQLGFRLDYEPTKQSSVLTKHKPIHGYTSRAITVLRSKSIASPRARCTDPSPHLPIPLVRPSLPLLLSFDPSGQLWTYQG